MSNNEELVDTKADNAGIARFRIEVRAVDRILMREEREEVWIEAEAVMRYEKRR